MPKLEIPQLIDDAYAARADLNTFEKAIDVVGRNRNILTGGLFAGYLGGLAYTVSEGFIRDDLSTTEGFAVFGYMVSLFTVGSYSMARSYEEEHRLEIAKWLVKVARQKMGLYHGEIPVTYDKPPKGLYPDPKAVQRQMNTLLFQNPSVVGSD